MTLTVNKDILLHPDFSQNLTEMLCNYLNSLIDEELNKEDADFDFIDECADAINSIRDGFIDAVLPVISRKDFMDKLGIKTVRFSKAFAAVIVAAIIILTTNTAIASATDYNIIEEVSKKIVEIIKKNEEPTKAPTRTTTTTAATEKTEQTTEESTATEKSDTEDNTSVLSKPVDITVEFGKNFKKEYYVGEKFNSEGLSVYLLYDDGHKEKIANSDYELEISGGFGKNAGYETITVYYPGYTCFFDVRILNAKETPLLTSVYATFPSDYDFKASNLSDIDLSFIKVYAVYSDDSKQELSADEYSVSITDVSSFTEEKVIVTVTYKTCSCSFTVFKE